MAYFSQYKKKTSSGFTLIELLIVLAIIALMSAVVTISFSSFGKEQALDKDTLTVLAVLQEAHSAAISSKDFSAYGVRMGTSSVTFFQGSYGTGNILYTLSNFSAISTSTGIGTDILFSNVSGNTTASGTITIYTKSDISKTNTIRIFSTGAIEKE